MLYKIDHRAKGWRVQREKTTKRVISQGFFLKKGHPRTLFHLFSSFQTNITIFTTNKGENYPSNIWRWDSNPQPLKHESPPVTTRPWLPPLLVNLVEQLLPTSDVFSLNPVSRKMELKLCFCKWILLASSGFICFAFVSLNYLFKQNLNYLVSSKHQNWL